MKAHQAKHKAARMCRVLGVSSSGYYAWQGRGLSQRAQKDQELLALITRIHQESDGTYGVPRVHAELCKAHNIHVGKKRVARLMRQGNLVGVSKRRYCVTTQRDSGAKASADLVHRLFTASAPNKLWVADITYVPTSTGFLYLSVVVDVFSRLIVGWSMSSSLATQLVLDALDMAVRQRKPQGVIHHSDQGCQFTSYAFGKRCEAAGIRPSMGTVGDAYDNAMCESFFSTLECELLARKRFKTHYEARLALFNYIEGWYNPRRRHSGIEYLSPKEYEKQYAQAA